MTGRGGEDHRVSHVAAVGTRSAASYRGSLGFELAALDMLVDLQIRGRKFTADLATGRSIAIPLRFAAAQPNLFGVPEATSQAIEQVGFCGDTRRGGNCNVRKWSLIPHCHGTHSESVSHIVDEEVPVTDCLGQAWLPALLTTVRPQRLHDSALDTYPEGTAQDWVIRGTDMEACVAVLDQEFPAEALVIRTLPNQPGKCVARYDGEPVPAYFSVEAMERLAASRVKHLLVDLPSVDRVFDGGRLRNHHTFWQVVAGSRRLSPIARVDRTITEFCFIPAELADGFYLMNVQLPDIGSDAVPSRPLLWPLCAEVET